MRCAKLASYYGYHGSELWLLRSSSVFKWRPYLSRAHCACEMTEHEDKKTPDVRQLRSSWLNTEVWVLGGREWRCRVTGLVCLFISNFKAKHQKQRPTFWAWQLCLFPSINNSCNVFSLLLFISSISFHLSLQHIMTEMNDNNAYVMNLGLLAW